MTGHKSRPITLVHLVAILKAKINPTDSIVWSVVPDKMHRFHRDESEYVHFKGRARLL